MPATKVYTSKCLYHGIAVTGIRGTVAQPKPYMHRDIFGGKAVRCWAVVDGEVHDVPVRNLVVA